MSPHLGSSKNLVLTFNQLISRTPFVSVMREMLKKLATAYGYPIDTEFTAFVESEDRVKINLLQCRPMRLPGISAPIVFPRNLPRRRVLFRATRAIFAGVVRDLRYIIYLAPGAYAEKASEEVKKTLGRIVGQLNQHPRIINNRTMMMGPGRWGTSNPLLGVNTSYADINHAAVLVELAREKAGHLPEVSYGSHFFQDLVEAQIIYLPVCPDSPAAEFNHPFFAEARNFLSSLLPQATEYEEFIKVIEVPSASRGQFAQVIADPRTQLGVCFLAE